MPATDDALAYFVRIDERTFRPTELTGGAWTTTEQHISPMNGLVVHEVERFCAERGPDGMAIGRISADILGVLPIEPFEIDVRVVRPGRTIELLEAVVTAQGRPAVRTRIWRSAVLDTAAIAGGEVAPLPDPDTLEPYDLTGVWPGGYIGSVETRAAGEPAPGRATMWVATSASVAAGEDVSDAARLTGLVDTANGVAVREDPREWLFPNLDLTVHYLRPPRGRWLGLDTTVTFGPSGHGITSSVLHDADGHVGYAQQTLTIRKRG